jgi:hypothetical protein
MLVITIIEGVIMAFWGSSYVWAPILEWITAFLTLNFFAIVSQTNPFYDSIHPYGKLVCPGGCNE